MDNFIEIILPLLFFAIYFASQFFSKKGSEEEEKDEQPDAMREIREQLRRKIEERRKAAEQGQQQQTTEPQTQDRAGGTVLRESRPRIEREIAPRTPTPVAIPTPAQPNYDRDLEARMEEVRRSEAQVESARKQALQSISKFAPKKQRRQKGSVTPHANYLEFLRSSLEDPESLRKSFLLSEVFGTPVGMREEGKIRPSWDL